MNKQLTLLAAIILAFGVVTSCQMDDSVYDINWPVPTINSVSTFSDTLSSTLSLTGNFTKVRSVYFGDVIGDDIEIAGDENSLSVKVPRTIDVKGAPIKVTNEYEQSYQTEQAFIPIIQETVVTDVSEIQVGLNFKVKGKNVDLLTEVTVDGVPVQVISKSENEILLSVSGLDLSAGMLVNVDFKSLARNEIPTAEKINVIYPFIAYNEVSIWDFEDGVNPYQGEGTAAIETGDVLGTQEKYFSLRAPGYGWDKETGNISIAKTPDFSNIVNPHLTFAVRTPAGSAGYFQMESPGSWRHFGYGFDTGGEWIIISQPLEDNWEGDGWNPGTFLPTLGLKAGNAGENQDIDIAYVKITEGKYDGSQEIGDALVGSTKPAKIVVMDFEDTSLWPDIMNGTETVASLDFRRDEIEPFYGDQFFTYVDDGTLGNWSGYWGQTISKSMVESQLSVFDDPYLSMALNSIEGNAQYIIVRIFQYDEQLVLVKKFFPDTNGTWQTAQFSLFNTDMENWSDSSTELGAHYATLKRLNKDEPIDRIEIIVNRNDANTVGISLDEVVITEGPRY
ncbi:hypothetical protein [Robertkochia aurantiaca]|uniref:hypothetical protein n=1 Tax=Robertkochia aurantiaca TaxID=2873700 RepID=UPI001CCFB224|nr:hypothetical protein [Robertkochia sp. 3YJGBD-33]